MTSSAQSLTPAGLAVYTDTARDMYVAGLLTESGMPPADSTNIEGPMGMEYRIATRRISMRGLSGTILLQAELGSGHRAPEGVIDALNELKSVVRGSLLNGDQFQVRLTPAGSTVFSLNGYDIVTVDGANSFQYLLSGWIGEGASAILRDSLLAGSIDAAVLGRYESLMPLNERKETVAGWVDSVDDSESEAAEQVAVAPEPEVVPAPLPEPEILPTVDPATQVAAVEPEATVEDSNTSAVVAAAVAASAVPETAPSLPAAASASTVMDSADLAEVEVESERVEIAEIAAQVETVSSEEVELAQLDDMEYQRRLNEYLSQVMTQVFGKVQYPRRAVSRSLQGQVELLAQINDAGQLEDLSMLESSGHGLLDRAAIAAVERAAPFPELDQVARAEFRTDDGNGYVLMIPVTFRLQ